MNRLRRRTDQGMNLLSIGRVACVGLTFGAAAAYAHSGATGIVKERMEGMKEMSYAAKAMGAVKAGAIPFSFATLSAAGREIAKHGAAARKLFPEGSLHSPSEALPAIWSDRETFDRLLDQMTAAAEQLSVSADRDEAEALSDRIGGLCKDCHATFRVKK